MSGTNSVMCVMGSVVHLKALVNTGSQELAAAGGPSATHLLYPLPVGSHISKTQSVQTHTSPKNNLSFSIKGYKNLVKISNNKKIYK